MDVINKFNCILFSYFKFRISKTTTLHTCVYLTKVSGIGLPNPIVGIFYEYNKAPLFLAIIREISEIRTNKNPIAAQAQNGRAVGKYVRRVTLCPERLRSAPSLSRQRHQPPEELRRAGLVPLRQYFNFIHSCTTHRQ